ncbi:hypothetical protein E2542_SST14207 [Spatholobus suberectus]|nr:hypothetical protein E2542_SST14207 [Spatholobus suberectus]
MDATDQRKGEHAPIKDSENPLLGKFDKPLPCFGCGIGWFSLLLGFVCPILWYYATILYFGNYYHKDPRERAGLAASAIAVSLVLKNKYTFMFCISAVSKIKIATLQVILFEVYSVVSFVISNLIYGVIGVIVSFFLFLS